MPPIGIRGESSRRRFLVARSVRIVSAALRSVSSIGSGTDGSGADADRHATPHGRATVSTAISAPVMNADAANTGASTAICERVG